jgi:hypothetical protein
MIEDKKKTTSGYLDNRLDVLKEIKEGLMKREIDQFDEASDKLASCLEGFKKILNKEEE